MDVSALADTYSLQDGNGDVKKFVIYGRQKNRDDSRWYEEPSQVNEYDTAILQYHNGVVNRP